MSKILLVSHYTQTPGMIDKFYTYLDARGELVDTILYPLVASNNLPVVVSANNRKESYKLFAPLQYCLEGFISVLLYRRLKKDKIRYSVAICFDPLSFFHIYVWKWYFKPKKIIYYNLDYSKNRFKNIIMNFIYQEVNRFSYMKCDYFFSVTEKFIEDIDPDKKYKNKNFIIKHMVNTKSINFKKRKIPHSIVYAGTLGYSINFKPLLIALQRLKKKKVKFIFHIFGSGPEENKIKNLVKRLGLEKEVYFKGVVGNQDLVENILPQYTIGVCPYITKSESKLHDHMFNGTDITSKLVEYIGAGLPIVATRLYEAFDLIEKRKFGFLAHKDDEWFSALEVLLKNDDLQGIYSKNALKLSKHYDEKNVLDPIFIKILRFKG